MKEVIENYTNLTGKPAMPQLGHLDCGYQLHLQQIMMKKQ